MRALMCLIAIGLVGLPSTASAQVADSVPHQQHLATPTSSDDSNPPISETTINDLPEDVRRMTSFEFNLSLLILGFGVLVLAAEVLLLLRVRCGAEEILRIFGITLIVIGALLVVPAGFSAQTVAPAMGLLGTIAGYLLSQRAPQKSDRKPSPEAVGPKSDSQLAPP